jgi:ABC-type uncharacterized transport system YnjBCD substrate-binding protein
MKFYFYLLAIIYSASLFGACPAMRKNAYKSSTASYASPARYATPAKAYDPNDPKNYKFSVNEAKFKTLSDARKYMTNLQKEAKKEGGKLEVIKVDRYNYKVISEKDAEEEYSQLSSSAK